MEGLGRDQTLTLITSPFCAKSELTLRCKLSLFETQYGLRLLPVTPKEKKGKTILGSVKTMIMLS
jgi:hypothetical protein